MKCTTYGFALRPYGLTELAQLYFPAYTPGGARRALLQWMEHNAELRQLLQSRRHDDGRQAGWQSRRLTFTPLQVERIVTLLGEP